MSIDTAKLRALNDIDDEAKTGKITHDEAREILSRFINSHFNNKGEHARATIPVDFTRDDDIRMAAYIVQMRKRDAELDTLRAEVERLRKAATAVSIKAVGRSGGSVYLIPKDIFLALRTALKQPAEGAKA